MKSSFGHNISYTLFGESHSDQLGITIEGLPTGLKINFGLIESELLKRQGFASFNTSRQEVLDYEIISGYHNNQTTGAPLTIFFKNGSVRSNDYNEFVNQPRPGHADHTAMYKYSSCNDYRGGGHLSGRMTIALVFVGGIIKQILSIKYPEMKIISHINKINDIHDLSYYDVRKNIVKKIFKARQIPNLDVKSLAGKDNLMQFNVAESIMQTNQKFLLNSIAKQDDFPVLSKNKKSEMLKMVHVARDSKDSLGGEIETIVINPPTNMGEPFFNSFESTLSHLIYSIPSIKGITFGNIEEMVTKHGSQVKDEIIFIDDSKAYTLYNHNGGINGGISNGDDIVFRSSVKPVSSIMQEQHTYDFKEKRIKPLTINGRHDASIINRIIPIIEAVTYMCIYDLLLEHKKRQLLI